MPQQLQALAQTPAETIEQAAPAQTAATTAPVVAGGDTPPDPERRLNRLRELGGTVKYKNGEWKFTGITKLVQDEKGLARSRSDVKTIRKDLKEAAQAERDAKKAGVFDGMGQGCTEFCVNGLMAGNRRTSRSGYDRKYKESST